MKLIDLTHVSKGASGEMNDDVGRDLVNVLTDTLMETGHVRVHDPNNAVFSRTRSPELTILSEIVNRIVLDLGAPPVMGFVFDKSLILAWMKKSGHVVYLSPAGRQDGEDFMLKSKTWVQIRRAFRKDNKTDP